MAGGMANKFLLKVILPPANLDFNLFRRQQNSMHCVFETGKLSNDRFSKLHEGAITKPINTNIPMIGYSKDGVLIRSCKSRKLLAYFILFLLLFTGAGNF